MNFLPSVLNDRISPSNLRFVKSNFFRLTLIAIAIFFLFTYLRRDRILSLQIANPDEAELMASGRRAMQSLIPYERFTSPTYGPAWAMLLGMLGKIGIPLTLPTAHLLSAFFGASICIVLVVAVSKLKDLNYSLVLLSPFIIYWAYGFNHSDYWSLSTELLPMFFIIIGSSVAFVAWKNPSMILVGASLVGFGAWSKYLFGLLGLAILLIFFDLLRKNGVRPLVALISVLVASNSISGLLFLIGLINGVPLSRLFESFSLTFEYIMGGGAGGTGTGSTVSFQQRMAALALNVVALFPLIPVLVASSATWYLSVRLKFARKVQLPKRGDKSVLVVLGATAITMISNPIQFPHYNYVLITGVMVALLTRLQICDERQLVSSNFDEETGSEASKSHKLNLLILFFVFCAVSPATGKVLELLPKINPGEVLDSKAALWERAIDDLGTPLSDFCPSGSTVFVWGWSSELYSFYDWKPASRYVAPAGLISGNNLNLDVLPLRARLNKEMDAEHPDCVVDAIGPSFFPGFGPESSLRLQMPLLWGALSERLDVRVFYWDKVNPILVLVPKMQLPSMEFDQPLP